MPITENTVVRGDALAVEHNLRGYDATHLACAPIWQETLGKSYFFPDFIIRSEYPNYDPTSIPGLIEK